MNYHKTALITGFTGQDGTFLTDLLLKRGYKVIGLDRRVSTEPPYRIRGNYSFIDEKKSGQLVIELGDLNSLYSLIRIFKKYKIDEVYNLAAQSDVRISFDQPELTSEVNYMGVINLITVMREFAPNAKLYQASTSELFGTNTNAPQNEETPFAPASPYAVSKLAAHWAVVNYRKEGHFACCGILFNHESELRGQNFVTRKITSFLGRYKNGEVLELGNLESRRDWGYAKDFVEGMYLMLQYDKPDDYILGTGETHTIKEFIEEAVKAIGKIIEWEGDGLNTIGYVNGIEVININPEFYRPVEVNLLCADYSKAQKMLGWKPNTKFSDLVKIMIEADS